MLKCKKCHNFPLRNKENGSECHPLQRELSASTHTCARKRKQAYKENTNAHKDTNGHTLRQGNTHTHTSTHTHARIRTYTHAHADTHNRLSCGQAKADLADTDTGRGPHRGASALGRHAQEQRCRYNGLTPGTARGKGGRGDLTVFGCSRRQYQQRAMIARLPSCPWFT